MNDMDDIVNKYLVDEKRDFDKIDVGKRKTAMEKLGKVIKSAKTEKQLDIAARMAGNFHSLYGNEAFDGLKRTLSSLFDKNSVAGKSLWTQGSFTLDKLIDLIDRRRDQIKHLGKNK